MRNQHIRELTVMAVIAGLYVALCYVFAFMSYGPVQFRIAEMLLVLVIYNKKYAAGVIIGTFIANQLMYGWIDMIIGTLATVLVCLAIILVKDMLLKKINAVLAASVFNGVIIGLMLRYIFDEPAALWFIMVTVALGQLAVVLAGVLIFTGIEKTNPRFIDIIKLMHNKREGKIQ
jgi:uncharacterized membrane protein